MKVILTEDVRGTGKKGDTVSVKDGYGRNFLIPRGFAIPASEGNVSRLDSIVRSLDNKRKRDIKNAEDQRTQLEELSLVLKMRAGSDGRLFGSVTHKDIADAIKNACSLEIDRKLIRLDEPIKMTGSHTVSIHLAHDVNASFKIEVEKQEE